MTINGSSQFILGIGNSDRNKVYFWNFEGWPDPDDYLEQGQKIPFDWQYRNLTLVANSFSEFLERIEPDPQ